MLVTGSYLVNFSPVVFTISNADVSPVDGYAYVTGVVNGYIADPNVLNIFTSTITGPVAIRVLLITATLYCWYLAPILYMVLLKRVPAPYGEESITLTRFHIKAKL